MPRPRARRLDPRTHRVQSIRLALGDASDNGLRWIQIAKEGPFDGYRDGPFELTRGDLQEMVDNFHAHPSFKPGAEMARADELQRGAFDVIPFDWKHLSTANAKAAPLELQVAQAWAVDFGIRVGRDGRAELWALCRYLEPMGSLVASGKVHWTSITAQSDYIEPVSGENRGWYVEAIAFTNDPFIQGMKVAADRQLALRMAHDPYNPPTSPEDVLGCLRELFELPATADLGMLLAEILKLKTWATSGGAPIGVEVDELVGAMRQIFNLPTLAPVADVFGAADGLLAALAASSAAEPSSLSRAPTMLNVHVAKLVALLSAAGVSLGRAPSTDDDAVEAVRDALPPFKVKLEKAASATSGLEAVLQALGVEDVAGASKKIQEMFKSTAALEKAMPELASLREEQASAEEETTEKDVGEAMQAHRIDERMKPAITFMRTGGVNLPTAEERKRAPLPQEQLGAILAGRRAARAKFLLEYPPVDPRALDLTRQAYPNPAGGGGNPKALAQPIKGIGDVVAIDLSGYAGRNATEKALSWIEQHDPAAAKYSRPQKFHAARKLLAQPNVTGAR